MKVERKEQPFEPIFITLETREEAVAMWHFLNMGMYAFEGYVATRKGLTIEQLKIPGAWEEFNKVFTPSADEGGYCA